MKCFGTGHFKRDCREERKEWLDYVDSFMLEAKLPDEYYGNWTRLVEDWRFKNKEKHDTNRNSQFETDEQQELEKEERNQSIEEISRILRDQREKASTRKMPEHLEEEPIDELGAMSIAANSNPFAILAAESNVTSQMEKRQTKKPKRGVGDGRGRAKGFLSLQGSPTDTPQSETQDE